MTKDASKRGSHVRSSVSGAAQTLDDDYRSSGLADNAAVRSSWISYAGISPAVALLDCLFIVSSAAFAELAFPGDLGVALVLVAPLVAMLFAFTTNARKLYDPPKLLDWTLQLENLLVTWTSLIVLVLAVAFAINATGAVSRKAFLLFATSGGVLLFANRLCWRFFIQMTLASGKLVGRTAIVLDTDTSSSAKSIATNLQRHGFRIARIFELPPSPHDEFRKILESVVSYVSETHVDEIFIIGGKDDSLEIKTILSQLPPLATSVKLIASNSAAELVRRPRRRYLAAIELKRPPLTILESFCKRTIDIFCAVFGLILLMPLLILTAVLIRLDSPGPVFFRQTRVGFNGRHFPIFKFRTMSVLEDISDLKSARGDSRVTRVGAFLRRANLDELPQLLNVLGGEMSIVGPRPHVVVDNDKFSRWVGDYAFRHHIKPGITGWAQVNGHRGETDPIKVVQQETAYDVWYIDNWSVRLDLTILLKTVLVLLRGKITAVAQRPAGPTRLPSNLSVGDHRYPLHPTAALEYDGVVMRLGYLEASAPTWDKALDLISRRLHRDFQRLWLVPPHERSGNDRVQLEKLTEIVDVQEYLRANRQEELVIGRVEAIDDYVIRLTLLTHEDQKITAHIDDLPAVAAGMQSGHYFEARILRADDSHIEWRNWYLRPPLREDDDVWTDFDLMTSQGAVSH
jgi:Undecaprenyl-phosphate glucose phosphotransferase